MESSNGESPGIGSFNISSASPAPNSHSSPENSPRTETNQMDTSVELNGLKSENRSSQQFCLRWNNHQVRIERHFHLNEEKNLGHPWINNLNVHSKSRTIPNPNYPKKPVTKTTVTMETITIDNRS